MILKVYLTDMEALALSQRLNCDIKKNQGKDINAEDLESGSSKLKAAMQKSDDLLSGNLDSAILSLQASGFDEEQIDALKSAKEKADQHNDKKYNR
jgi:hypothetical protein